MNLTRTMLASLLSLCCMTGSSLGGTQVGDLRITMQPGQCRSLLNGVDIGCPTGAVHTRLENGRHLVNLPASDLTSIGFAGQKLETTGNLSSVLWVDAAYVNQQRVLADGQCTFERKANGGIE